MVRKIKPDDSCFADGPDPIRLSQAQIDELDRRIDCYERSPQEGTEWAQMKSELLDRIP